MCQRYQPSVVAALLLAVSLGCDETRTIDPTSQNESTQQPALGYATPQLVFDEAKAAAIENDTPRIIRCFTPESQNAIATYTLAAAAMMRIVADGFAERGDARYLASKAKVDAVLAKYSIDLSAISGTGIEPGSANMDLIARIADSITDKPTLTADLLAELEAAKGGDSTDFQDELIGDLVDVEIRGTFAEGVVENSKASANAPVAYYFRKGADGWLIHMPAPTE